MCIFVSRKVRSKCNKYITISGDIIRVYLSVIFSPVGMFDINKLLKTSNSRFGITNNKLPRRITDPNELKVTRTVVTYCQGAAVSRNATPRLQWIYRLPQTRAKTSSCDSWLQDSPIVSRCTEDLFQRHIENSGWP